MFGFEFGTVIILAMGILGVARVVRRKLKNPDMSGLKPAPEFTMLRIFGR